MSTVRDAKRIEDDFPTVYKRYNEEKDIFGEGVFVSEFVNDEDDDDDEYEYIREPRTEFEKSVAKVDMVLRQSEQDTQFLSHDLVSISL